MSRNSVLAGQMKLAELPNFKVINNKTAVPKKVVLIFDEAENSTVTTFIEKFDERKVKFIKNIDWNKAIKEDVLKKYDYIVFFVSEKSMKNRGLVLLLLRYSQKNNFIPIISDTKLFELKNRVGICDYWIKELDYTKNLMANGQLNEDILQEHLVDKEINSMLGSFFRRATDINVLRGVESVFEARLCQDDIYDLKKSCPETNLADLNQEGKQHSVEGKVVKMGYKEGNIYANNVTINEGGVGSQFETTVNNNEPLENINKILEQVSKSLMDSKKSDTDEICCVIEELKDELKKDKYDKHKINSIIDTLASITTVATGIPNLQENFAQLFTVIQNLPML